MPPKRSSAVLRASSSSSTDSTGRERSHKRRRSASVQSSDENRALRVYIVPAKLEAQTLRELHELVGGTDSRSRRSSSTLSLTTCIDVNKADIIITAIRMRKRLERHVDWEIAKQKAILTPEWLLESVKQGQALPCGSFASLSDLPTIQLHRFIVVFFTIKHSPQAYRPSSLPELEALITELAILYNSRDLEGLKINALSYERSIAIIKSYPYPITEQNLSTDICKLPGLGDKTLSKIEEYVDKGFIEESQTILKTQRYQSLSLFSTVYGIGPATARKLFDLGLRTLEDLERYYDVPTNNDITALEADFVTPNGRRIPTDNKPPDISIKVALCLRKELNLPIPRGEVEEMHRTVMAQLEHIHPGCVSIIVGGYRRGKAQSNDVDIIISHAGLKSGASHAKGLCTKLTKQLYDRGLVTHVMRMSQESHLVLALFYLDFIYLGCGLDLSGFHAPNALKTENWDSLEKALTVFRLPSDGKRELIHRRLDLIFACPESYWTAVIGWSGSKMFERDLRLWAKVEKGMKFDSSGLTRRHDSKLFNPRSEEEVFEILGLRWIDPTMRNADA